MPLCPVSAHQLRMCNGVHAYHAWAFEKRDGGVYVLTEETQTGWKARLRALVMPHRMSRWHQSWLEGLGEQARNPPR
jgi:hypothetical protein